MSAAHAAGAAVVLLIGVLLGAAPFLAFRRLRGALGPVRRVAGALLVVLALAVVLPEAVRHVGLVASLLLAAAGAGVFAALVWWLHARYGGAERGTVGAVLAVSALHKAADGVLVGVAFSLGPEAGWASVGAILLHELPHEGSTFALLLAAGAPVRRALGWKLAAGLTVVPGVAAGLAAGGHAAAAVPWMLPLVAGGFLYVGAAAAFGRSHRPAPRMPREPQPGGTQGCLGNDILRDAP